MLASADNVKPPKSKKLKIDWKSSPIDVNYTPSRRLNLEPTFTAKQPGIVEEDNNLYCYSFDEVWSFT